MTIPLEEKVGLMKELHKNLYDPEWKYRRSQEADKIVLEEFPVVSKTIAIGTINDIGN